MEDYEKEKSNVWVYYRRFLAGKSMEGIMVFQDFMLACGVFPQNEDFLRKLAVEAEFIIKKYRNYTSLVLWSCDNESDQFYDWFDPHKDFKGNLINRKVLKDALEKFDDTRPYLVSSPVSPFEEEAGGKDPNAELQGDMHIYFGSLEPGDSRYYKNIRNFVPRFLSEFGFSSLPCKDTYRRFNFYREPLKLGKDPWLDKQEEFADYITKQDEESVIYYSRHIQAQGLKYWIEYLRSYKGICGGALYWKFNDPVACNRPNMLFPTMMSVIDFYGKTKLSYYYARRAYEDGILAFRENQEGGLSLYFCNETEESLEGILEVKLLRFHGEVLCSWQEAKLIEADSSRLLIRLPMEDNKYFPGKDCYLRACFQSGVHSIINRFSGVALKECFTSGLSETKLEVSGMTIKEGGLELDLASDVFAQDVMLTILDTDAYYSDNCFCMDAGEEKHIVVRVAKESCYCNLCLRIEAHNAYPQLFDLNDL